MTEPQRPQMTFATGGNEDRFAEPWRLHYANIERHLTEILAARNREDYAAIVTLSDAIEYSAQHINGWAKRRAEAAT